VVSTQSTTRYAGKVFFFFFFFDSMVHSICGQYSGPIYSIANFKKKQEKTQHDRKGGKQMRVRPDS
jgi:hypothetical protein